MERLTRDYRYPFKILKEVRKEENMLRKKLGIFMLSAGMVYCLSACGGTNGSDIVEGSWNLTKGYSGETEVSLEDLEEAGMGGTTFTFKDGKVSISMEDAQEISEGTYSLDGTTVTISAEDEEVSYTGTVADDVLTISEDDLKLVFEKE